MTQTIHFHKYQGTGNDFILLNNIDGNYSDLSIPTVQRLCDRKFGIGADGLIKLDATSDGDFEADYYNADGTKSFCRNGARCSVMFAKSQGIFTKNKTKFTAIDGLHEAEINENLVFLKMNDVSTVKTLENLTYETNTGSPHYLRYFENLDEVDIFSWGRSIRYNETYRKEGINVNAIQEIAPNKIKVQTYERGVENETLSCGTGVTAAALSFAVKNHLNGEQIVAIETKGGKLSVRFHCNEHFTDIWLIGPAEKVFEGTIQL